MSPALISRLFLRVALGSVFIVSGFQKLISPAENFAAVIEKFDIVHGAAVTALSLAMPWAEFIGGTLLVLGLWTPVTLGALWLMNTLFIGVLASALWRKVPVGDCGCFGKNLSIPLPVMLAVDGAIWALFLLSFLLRRKPAPSLDSFLARHG